MPDSFEKTALFTPANITPIIPPTVACELNAPLTIKLIALGISE